MALNTTFVAGTTVISAAHLNGIQSASASYACTWSASAGTPAVGNGTLTSTWNRVGKWVDFRIELTFGTTTTMGTAGSVQRFTLPATPVSTQRHRFLGTAYDNGVADYTVYFRWVSGGPYLEVVAQPTTAGNGDRTVSNTVPFTWGSTDVLMVQGRYEAA